MSLEVQSSAQSDTPRRAWASSLGLILGVTALAWSMTSGERDRHVGAVEQPPGWGFSYRLPRAFKRLDIKTFPAGTIRRYESGQGASRLILSVWRFNDAEKLTASRVCDLVLQASSRSPHRALAAGQATPREEWVGRFPAKEVESPALAMVVRAVVINESAVAFALNGLEPSAVRRGYAAFDLSCRSVEFAND